MGTLRDLLPEVKKVNIGRGEVEVVGLDIPHVSVLLTKYGPSLEPLFADTKGDKPDFSILMGTLPEMMQDIIAMGIGAEDQMDDVRRIPLSAKIEILQGIWALSVSDSKKLLAELKEAAEKARALRQEIGA